MGNRKSLANQMRMKNIANLASDMPGKKRRRNNDDDTFGANDNDWEAYRVIQKEDVSDDDEAGRDDLDAALGEVERQLLAHDPLFTEEHTRDAETDWTKSLMHAFLRGPWPFDPESQREAHQVHLNVERIRVPEVVFQPSMAGLDQAGVAEIAGSVLAQRLRDHPRLEDVLKDVFLTGGNTMFDGFEERLRRELRAVLDAEWPLRVRRARDPVLDAWRGAAAWAGEAASAAAFVTKAEYQEKGPEYIKVTIRGAPLLARELTTGEQEHDLGNSVS
jgi:actin-related protein 5